MAKRQPKPSQLKGFSDLLTEPFDIGLPSSDANAILELGHELATSRPGLIVYVDGPALQQWDEVVP